jgi:hypothetical protein
LSLRDFHLYLVNQKVNTLASFALDGKTYNQSMLWLEEHIGSLNLGHTALSMHLPYEMPQYETQTGKKFEVTNIDSVIDFGGYYHNSFILLNELKEIFPETSSICIWPHHFDQAMIITLKETGDPSTNTSVSPGYSPGDALTKEPYFYVNCWPHADPKKLGPLTSGAHWNTEEWVGGVLPASTVWKHPHQKELIADFFKSAIDQLSHALLD